MPASTEEDRSLWTVTNLSARLDQRTSANLEVGYLNQWINRPGENLVNHTLAV